MQPAIDVLRCGRRTRRGTLCQGRHARVMLWPGPDYVAPVCWQHLTEVEGADLAAVEQAREDARTAAWNAAPACHSWPIPDSLGNGTYLGDLPDSVDPELNLDLRLMEWQGGRCAICGRSGSYVEDHCHRSGFTRGYLCAGCNTREGLSDIRTLQLYRERPPAVIIGITWRYVGYGHPNGALPESWVKAALGPQPPDYSPAAVRYLAAAAVLQPVIDEWAKAPNDIL